MITGATSGIGKALVEAFDKAGWQVVATSKNGTIDLDKSSLTNRVKFYKLDVADRTSIKQAFATITEDFPIIDVVVNNAGYGLEGVFEDMTTEQIRSQFDTNVFGLMDITREAIKEMRKHGGGTIIQIASMGGRMTFPLYSIYHASKWAVEGFSESLHYELSQFGIKIKIIEPGVINTEFYRKNRVFVQPKSELGYDDFLSKVAYATRNVGKDGEDPSVVAKVVLRAATDKSNKIRYSAGKPASLYLFLRKSLPDKLFYKIVTFRYKI